MWQCEENRIGEREREGGREGEEGKRDSTTNRSG